MDARDKKVRMLVLVGVAAAVFIGLGSLAVGVYLGLRRSEITPIHRGLTPCSEIDVLDEESLRKMLKDPDAEERVYAARRLCEMLKPGELGAQTRKALGHVATNDPSARVRADAVTTLGKLWAWQEINRLVDLMEDTDPEVRHRACVAVMRIFPREVPFDPRAPLETRRTQVEHLRKLVNAPETRRWFETTHERAFSPKAP